MTNSNTNHEEPYRSHTCALAPAGDVLLINNSVPAQVGDTVTLCGFVDARRDLGNLIFIQLRDRYGKIQCTFDPQLAPETHTVAEKFRPEFVVSISGTVTKRANENINPNLPNGDIEIIAQNALIFTEAKTPPFYIKDDPGADELLRMEYRYLDLRRNPLQKALKLRHDIVFHMRKFFNERGFLEIETPVLGKSTPEGARDYLVPSRVNPAQFYALPQSPQLYKQLFMVAGLDRYFQIARCYRDEDLRADRQPEFTQLDVEMSFCTADELYDLFEKLFCSLYRDIAHIDIPKPFTRLTYEQAMNNYGSDKPDLRFELVIRDLQHIFKNTSIEFIRTPLENGHSIRGIVDKPINLSRKQLDELTAYAKSQGMGGLIYLNLDNNELKGNIAKLFEAETERKSLTDNLGESFSMIALIGDANTINPILGNLRLKLAALTNAIPTNAPPKFVWIVDYPMFEIDADNPSRLTPKHHAFTMPLLADLPKLWSNNNNDLLSIRADSYDLVLDGNELSSGSLRVYDPKVQQRIFELIGLDREQAIYRFGWFLRAYEYGAPPHRGFAPGIDRTTMIMLRHMGEKAESLRDVIAFPKTTAARDPMTDAPSFIDQDQLEALYLKTTR